MSAERKTSFFEIQALLGSLFLSWLGQTVLKIPKRMYAEDLGGHSLGPMKDMGRILPRYNTVENTLHIESKTRSIVKIDHEEIEIIDKGKKGTVYTPRANPQNKIKISAGETVTLPNGVEVSNIRD